MDVAGYIGIPFKDKGRDRAGLDCWGLLRLIYLEQLGVELPLYLEGYESAADTQDVARLIKKNMGSWTPVEIEEPCDGILMTMAGEPMHVGVVIGQGEMVHVIRGIDVCVERYRRNPWRHRVIGFYRHNGQHSAH